MRDDQPTCRDMWPWGACPRCGAENPERVVADDRHIDSTHGVKCHQCGQTSWWDDAEHRWLP